MQKSLKRLRDDGWTVAVHNDYRLNGEPHTFWLFTKNGRAVKGEGSTDEEALAEIEHRAFGPVAEVLSLGKGQDVRIRVGAETRSLPIVCLEGKGLSVAVLDALGDWKLLEEAGRAMARLVPHEAQALLMPDGKAQALLHVVGRETSLPTVVARKSLKPWVKEPVISASAESVTTAGSQTLYLDASAGWLRGLRVAFVDDVVSTGGSLAAAKILISKAGAEYVGAVAMFTEGAKFGGVRALGHLPVFPEKP